MRLIVFPEMCIPGYWHVVGMDRPALATLAESVPDGPSATALLELSRSHGMVVGAGLLEADGDALYNSYVVAEPDGSWHVHRKLHAFESEHISPGDRYIASTLGCTLRVLTCYDNNIVENPRMTTLAGADILLAPHQTGGVASRSPHAMGTIDVALWEARDSNPQAIEAEFRGDKGRGWLMRWLPSRAHDNGMFLVFSNGVAPQRGGLDRQRHAHRLLRPHHRRDLAGPGTRWCAASSTPPCCPAAPAAAGSEDAGRSCTGRCRSRPGGS